MRVVRNASAGTLESSDVHVYVSPGDATAIEIESVVAAQFEDAIKQAVLDVIDELKVTGAQVTVKDSGALDCTIRARVETALRRAVKEG